jgi:hypothetical protein
MLRKLPAHLRDLVKDWIELRFLADKAGRKFLQPIGIYLIIVVYMRHEACPNGDEDSSRVILEVTVASVTDRNTNFEGFGKEFEVKATTTSVGIACVTE